MKPEAWHVRLIHHPICSPFRGHLTSMALEIIANLTAAPRGCGSSWKYPAFAVNTPRCAWPPSWMTPWWHTPALRSLLNGKLFLPAASPSRSSLLMRLTASKFPATPSTWEEISHKQSNTLPAICCKRFSCKLQDGKREALGEGWFVPPDAIIFAHRWATACVLDWVEPMHLQSQFFGLSEQVASISLYMLAWRCEPMLKT